jgi:hypothetical protein
MKMKQLHPGARTQESSGFSNKVSLASCRCSVQSSYFTDKDNWNRVLPSYEELPKDWPGKESVEGLRREHLTPDCRL